MPLSAESLRTEGASGASAGAAVSGLGRSSSGPALIGFVVSDLRSGRPVVLSAAMPCVLAAAGFAGALPSAICPSSAPTATVSPSLATSSASVPAEGAGTSMVTLSVSSSTSGSSTDTASPGFLNHFPIVASVTDSPSVGTRISVMVLFLSSWPTCPEETAAWIPETSATSGPRVSVRHDCPCQSSASSMNALSCARCFDINPVAVAAAAARPV